jgi:hypothetical protein
MESKAQKLTHRPRRFVAALAVLAAALAFPVWAGCSAALDEGDAEQLGVAQIALTNVPADGSVGCVRVTATGDVTEVRAFDVTPGESAVFPLEGLPTGTVLFSGDAFPSICAVVGSGTTPSWVSDDVVATVDTVVPVSITLTMHRNGKAGVGVDFDDAGCRSNGVVCAGNGECCSGQCAGDTCCTPLGEACSASSDCCTGLCNLGYCQSIPGCIPNGASCSTDAECCNASCHGGLCQLPGAATCADGAQNQGETGVDCGGPCAACPTCADGALNQGETGVDCGGPCAACPTCADGAQNQGETGVDCGGPCAACPPTCVVVQRGTFGTVSDTYIDAASGAPRNTNFGSAATVSVELPLAGGSPRLGLFRWDLAFLPVGASITSATVSLTTTGAPTGSLRVLPITAAWVEGTVTWNSFAQGYNNVAFLTLNGPLGATVTFDVTALAQGWHSGASANQGIVLRQSQNVTSSTIFVSSEGAQASRPALTVCYL